MEFGTFLLMQSPSARHLGGRSTRARRRASRRRPKTLGFRNVWLGEHHFSTYGYLSRPLQLALYIAARRGGCASGTAVIVVPLHHPLLIAEEIATARPPERRAARHRARARLPALRVRAPRACELDSSRSALGGSGRHHAHGFRRQAVQLRGQATSRFPRRRSSRSRVQKPRPPIWVTAQSPYSIEAAVRRGFNLLTGGFGVPDRAAARNSAGSLRRHVAEHAAGAAAPRRRAARRSTSPRTPPMRAPPPSRRAGTCG